MKIVPPENSTSCPLWVIGEAPGEEESLSGRPFVGGAGKVLNLLLQSAGITRSSCYIRNVAPIQPDRNNFGQFYLDKSRKKPTDELLTWWQELQNAITTYNPMVVIALGDEALKALTLGAYSGISNHRGSILPINNGKTRVVATHHPEFVMRIWNWYKVVEADLRKARSELENWEPLPVVESYIADTLDAVFAWEKKLTRKDITYLSCDIETTNSLTMTCIGFSAEPNVGVTFPLMRGHQSFWSPEHELIVLGAIDRILKAPTPKVFQNGCYDLTWLENKYGFVCDNLYFDTMLAQHILYPELGTLGKNSKYDEDSPSGKKSLAFLTSLYTRYPYHKDMSKEGTFESSMRYNALDCITTYLIAEQLEKQLRAQNLWDFYNRASHDFIRIVCDMTWKGIKVDPAVRVQAELEMAAKAAEHLQTLQDMAGYELNPNSPKQVAHYLYDELGLPVQRAKQGTGRTTDKAALNKLLEKFPSRRELQLIEEYRNCTKLLSTVIRADLGSNSTFHTSYNIAGTVTGRWSSGTSFLGGGNLQNIQKGVCRRLFVPDEEDMLFFRTDLSQADARVLAWISGDPAMIGFFQKRGDIHTYMATIYLKCDESEVSSDVRQTFKKGVHASNYDVQPKTFAAACGISVVEAADIMSCYLTRFPGVRAYHAYVQRELKTKRTLTTPLGRRRQFLSRFDSALFREAYSFLPQSTVADWINLALKRTRSVLPPGARISLQTHDDFAGQCYAKDKLLVESCIAYGFDISVDVNGQPLTIPYECKFGNNWNEVS